MDMSQPENPCPDCGGPTHVHLKDEAGYAKYWFICNDHEDCRWESRTFRGPRRSEDEIDEIGFERHTELFRRDARQEAAEVDTSELA